MKHLIIFLAAILSFCKLEARIYVSGAQSSHEGDLSATLWVLNDKDQISKTTHLSQNAPISAAYGAVTVGSNVYCAGYKTINEINHGTLWITSLQGDIKDSVDLGENSAAVSLISTNHQLYIVGELNSHSTLWIYNLETKSMEAIQLSESDSYASSVTYIEDVIYVVGVSFFDSHLMLWSLGLTDGNITTLDLGKTFAIEAIAPLYYINHVADILFISASEIIDEAFYATLWSINTKQMSIKKTRLGAVGSVSSSYAHKDNKLYIYGFNFLSQADNSLLWITDLKGDLLQEISIDESGVGFSMGSLRNYLYFVLNNVSSGSILKTGLLGAPIKRIDLGQENQDSIAFNIYVAPELLDAVRELSPLKFQKGF